MKENLKILYFMIIFIKLLEPTSTYLFPVPIEDTICRAIMLKVFGIDIPEYETIKLDYNGWWIGDYKPEDLEKNLQFVNERIDAVQGEIQNSLDRIERVVFEIQDDMEFKLIAQAVRKIQAGIDVDYSRMLEMAENIYNLDNITINAFVDELTIGMSPIEKIIRQFHGVVYIDNDGYFSLVSDRVMKEDAFDTSFESIQNALYNFYVSLIGVELKAYLMQQFAYYVKIVQDRGNFITEVEIATNGFAERISFALLKMEPFIKIGERYMSRPDPKIHELGKSYEMMFNSSFSRTRDCNGTVTIAEVGQPRYFCSEVLTSDVDRNMVVTGLRFVLENGIFCPQIYQSKLLPDGKINSSISYWKKLPSSIYKNSSFVINYDFTGIYVNDITLNQSEYPNFITTGIQFKRDDMNYKTLQLQVIFNKFNPETGQILPKVHVKTNDTYECYTQTYESPTKYINHKKVPNIHVVNFGKCSDWDLEEEIVPLTPFIDLLELKSVDRALSGLGFQFRGRSSSGGFLAPKLITYPINLEEYYFNNNENNLGE